MRTRLKTTAFIAWWIIVGVLIGTLGRSAFGRDATSPTAGPPSAARQSSAPPTALSSPSAAPPRTASPAASPASAGCVPSAELAPVPGVIEGLGSEDAVVSVEGTDRSPGISQRIVGGPATPGPSYIGIMVYVRSGSAAPATVSLYSVTPDGAARTIRKLDERALPADGASASDAPGWFQWLWMPALDDARCFQIVIVTSDGATTARFAVVDVPHPPGQP